MRMCVACTCSICMPIVRVYGVRILCVVCAYCVGCEHGTYVCGVRVICAWCVWCEHATYMCPLCVCMVCTYRVWRVSERVSAAATVRFRACDSRVRDHEDWRDTTCNDTCWQCVEETVLSKHCGYPACTKSCSVAKSKSTPEYDLKIKCKGICQSH